MAENYSLNAGFGFNVSSKEAKTRTAPKVEVDLAQNVSDMFDKMTGYVAKYENVFNGDVEKEINMYSRQSMIVAMNLKAGNERRQFDMNI